MKSAALVPALALLALPALAHAQVSATVTVGQPAAPSPQPVYAQPYGYQPQPVYVAPQPMYVPRGRRFRQVYDYHGGPIPPGATLRTGRAAGLYVPGLAIFAVTFVINEIVGLACAYSDAATTSSSSHLCAPGMGWLAVPVAGPWLALGTNTGPRSAADTDVLVFDGVLHTAGFAMFILGMVITHQTVVVNGYADNDETPRHRANAGPIWAVTPMAAPGTYGAALTVTNF